MTIYGNHKASDSITTKVRQASCDIVRTCPFDNETNTVHVASKREAMEIAAKLMAWAGTLPE